MLCTHELFILTAYVGNHQNIGLRETFARLANSFDIRNEGIKRCGDEGVELICGPDGSMSGFESREEMHTTGSFEASIHIETCQMR